MRPKLTDSALADNDKGRLQANSMLCWCEKDTSMSLEEITHGFVGNNKQSCDCKASLDISPDQLAKAEKKSNISSS